MLKKQPFTDIRWMPVENFGLEFFPLTLKKEADLIFSRVTEECKSISFHTKCSFMFYITSWEFSLELQYFDIMKPDTTEFVPLNHVLKCTEPLFWQIHILLTWFNIL